MTPEAGGLPAWQTVRASGAGPAAHRGAACRLCSMVQILDVHNDTSVPEHVIEVSQISCPPRPLLAALPATQMSEQLVDVPVPESVILARGWGAAGRTWFQVMGTRKAYWWMVGAPHVQWDLPESFTASPGRYAPVILQLKFQQSQYEKVKVPQIQFLDRLPEFQLCQSEWVRTVQTEDRRDSCGYGFL